MMIVEPFQSCTITGHPPQRFKFKYNEHYKLCIKIKKALTTEISKFYSQGVRTFWVGGSIGVDTWAAEMILDLKKQERYKDIRLCVALPFPEFKSHFDAKQQTRLKDILGACDEQITISERESEKCYYIRNEYMVDRSCCLLAVYDNDRSVRSDAGMIVHYAEKKGLAVRFIHPDTAVVN